MSSVRPIVAAKSTVENTSTGAYRNAALGGEEDHVMVPVIGGGPSFVMAMSWLVTSPLVAHN